MAWTTRHVFAYQEVPTAANLNNNFANVDETSPGKVTTKADMTAATGANAIARIAGGSIRWWGPVTVPSETSGIKFQPIPVVLDYAYSSYTVVNTVTETDTWSKALTAGMPGAKELLHIHGYGTYTNNSGANRTFDLKFYIGTTAYSITTGAIGTSATSRLWFYDIYVRNLNAINSQHVAFSYVYHTTDGSVGGDRIATTGTGTDDFTTSKTIKLSVTHSAASANLSITVYHPVIEIYGSMT